jgi:glycosidase
MNLLHFKSRIKVLKTTIIAALLALVSCGSTSYIPITPCPLVVNENPIQYGSPFFGVPDARDAVIYQVNMRSFSTGRNFQGVTARLDSIKSLGVSVIYLMPIYPVGTMESVNSPYCVKDYKAINAEFGTLTDLRALIDGAHSRGMSVILDWVANHTAWDNSWINNTSWYSQDASGNIQSPSGWTDVAQLNFKNTEMRKAMIKAMKYWVYTANCDGFRCDYADGPPADFWKQAIDTLRNISTHKLLMMAEGTRADHFSSGFNYIFGFRFYEQMKTIFSNNQAATNFDNLNTTEYTGASASESNMVVRYIANHDANSSDGTPLDLFGGSKGSMTAFVVAAYMKGVPMIYNGQEVGTTYRLTFPFTGTTINWSSNPGMVSEYKKIIAFRNSSKAIRRGTLVSYSNSNVCAFTKTSDTETVFVLSNLRNSNVTYTLPTAVSNSQWTDAFSNATVLLTNQITLAPSSYLVLKK